MTNVPVITNVCVSLRTTCTYTSSSVSFTRGHTSLMRCSLISRTSSLRAAIVLPVSATKDFPTPEPPWNNPSPPIVLIPIPLNSPILGSVILPGNSPGKVPILFCACLRHGSTVRHRDQFQDPAAVAQSCRGSADQVRGEMAGNGPPHQV